MLSCNLRLPEEHKSSGRTLQLCAKGGRGVIANTQLKMHVNSEKTTPKQAVVDVFLIVQHRLCRQGFRSRGMLSDSLGNSGDSCRQGPSGNSLCPGSLRILPQVCNC